MEKKTKAERITKTHTDTIIFTPKEAADWPLPSFQRTERINEKIRVLAEQIAADSGVLPGILTFGILNGRRYLVDGQHRRAAFLLSGRPEGVSDARFCEFATMAEMANEYVRLNSRLVAMRPDDILKGLEESLDCLKEIRKACPWVGYDITRRGENAPIVSMSAILRAWNISRPETPSSSPSAMTIAQEIQPEEWRALIAFLVAAIAAWGRDPEYARLWKTLNVSLTMWLFRRVVLAQDSGRADRLSIQQFQKGLAALAADGAYLDWLFGRNATEHHRAPAYARITQLFGQRLNADRKKKLVFPRPPWALGRKSSQGRRVGIAQ